MIFIKFKFSSIRLENVFVQTLHVVGSYANLLPCMKLTRLFKGIMIQSTIASTLIIENLRKTN